MKSDLTPVLSAVVHIDGSCLSNPGVGGWAYVFQSFDDGEEVFRFSSTGSDVRTTNGKTEMQAAIGAFRFMVKLAPHIEVTIVTDSEMLFKGMTEWLPGWKRRGWRRADGKPVLNGDLWMMLDDLQSVRPVQWRWTRAHVGTAMNEEADKLARGAAEKLRAELRAADPFPLAV